MLPASAFQAIKEELERQPLNLNRYRKVAGDGRSQAFGVVGKRCMPPDYSRQCWRRPYLYKLLLDFASEHVHIPFNSITVNQNYKAGKHYDKNNIGQSFLVAFGDYTGGELQIHEGDLSGSHDIRCKPVVADFSKILHSVSDFQGNRYSLVFYQYSDDRWPTPDLPPPSVVLDDGKWKFKRGDKIIERREGLPHPLRGYQRKQSEAHVMQDE